MSDNLTTIIISLVTVLFGGGAWKFYEFLVKKNAEDKKSEKSEQTTKVSFLEKENNELKIKLRQ